MSRSTTERSPLPIIIAVTGMGVLTFSLIAPVLPDLADALGVPRSSIGLIQGAVAVPGIFLAMAIGYLADKKGRRFIGVASLLVFGIAGAAGYFTRSFWPLVLVRAIQGLGTSGILSLGVIVIGDTYPPGTERRRAIGINSAGLTLTGMFAPIIGGTLGSIDPFLPFLVFSAAIPLAFFAMRLPGKPDGPPPEPPIRHIRATFRHLRSTGRLSDFLGLLPFATFSLIVFAGLGFTMTPLYLESVFDVGPTGRGLMQSVLSVGSTSASLSSARLTDRYSPSVMFTVGVGLIATGFAALAIAPNLVVVGLGLCAFGLGLGLAFPLLQNFVTSSVPGAYRGAAVGAFVTSVRLGQAFGPVIGSAAAVTPGPRPAYAAAAGFTLVIALAWSHLRRGARRLVEHRHPSR